jgi:hypothetical protein
MIAFMAYCRGLDALDQNDFDLAQEFFKEAVKIDPEFEMARDRIVPMSLWDATHAANVVRVSTGVAEHITRVPGGEVKLAVEPSTMVGKRGRLQQMGIYQDAGFIPGNDTRETFVEADAKSLLVFPDLGVPPLPPSGQ